MSKTRVVLIDDAVEYRHLVKEILEDSDFEVTGEASDGQEGLEVVARDAPDLVLLDLAMPVMDGFETLPLLKEQSDAKILVLSGFTEASVGRRVLDLGADGVLEKGAEVSALEDAMHALLDARTF